MIKSSQIIPKINFSSLKTRARIGLVSKLIVAAVLSFFLMQDTHAADFSPFGFTFGISFNELSSRVELEQISPGNRNPLSGKPDDRLILALECKKSYDSPTYHLAARNTSTELLKHIFEVGWKEKNLAFEDFINFKDARSSFPRKEEFHEAALARSREIFLFRDTITNYEYCVIFAKGKLAAVFADLGSDLKLKNQILEKLASKLIGRKLSTRFLTSESFMSEYLRMGRAMPEQKVVQDTVIMSSDHRYYVTSRDIHDQSSISLVEKLFITTAQMFDSTYEHIGIIDLNLRKHSVDAFAEEIPEFELRIAKHKDEINAEAREREHAEKALTQARQRILDSVSSGAAN